MNLTEKEKACLPIYETHRNLHPKYKAWDWLYACAGEDKINVSDALRQHVALLDRNLCQRVGKHDCEKEFQDDLKEYRRLQSLERKNGIFTC